jgi:CRISPR/Cas system CMR-associated protein Cmr5 small subunit
MFILNVFIYLFKSLILSLMNGLSLTLSFSKKKKEKKKEEDGF